MFGLREVGMFCCGSGQNWCGEGVMMRSGDHNIALHFSRPRATPTAREKHPKRKTNTESEAETCRAVAGTVLAALLGAHDSGAVSSLWLLGLDWVWQASGRAFTSGFGRATLLESWELALSLAEQPCCRAGMMAGERGRGACCTAFARAIAGRS